MRRPIGDHGVGCAPRWASDGSIFSRVGLQRVDAQIERRPARHRGRLRDAVVAEHLRQMAVEPFRIIAGDVRRRLASEREVSAARSAVGQRLRREAAAVAQGGDRIGIDAALELEHAQHAAPAACRRP